LREDLGETNAEMTVSKKFSAKPVVTIVGSANIDFSMQVPQLPAIGETITGGRFFQTFGGKGANQAVAAARAGAITAWIGATGADAMSLAMRRQLAECGLDLSDALTLNGANSGTALIIFDRKGRNYLTVDSGSNAHLKPGYIDAVEERLASSDWILLQMEIPEACNLRVLEIAQRHGVPVLLNYAPASHPGFPLDQRVEALVVNETEASVLLSRTVEGGALESCKEGAMALLEAGRHRWVIITLGEFGAILAHREGTQWIPPFAVEAVDTTAAGDTFCGYLGVALAEKQPIAEAVRLASAAAALSVTRVGAQPSIPTRIETDRFLREVASA
jgi:ribokinase